MELKDLVGNHELSGIDLGVEQTEGWNGSITTSNSVKFRLDGIVYKAIEDPNDGWRSYLKNIEICDENEKIQNNFFPHKVKCIMKPDGDHSTNNTLIFIDSITNKIVLEIGTDNTDDWYSHCVMHWNPKNLASNRSILIPEYLKGED